MPHRDRLYRLALSLTGQTAEAEDIVQDTVLRAWEQRDSWSQVQNMAAWLSQICKNLALDRIKRTNATKKQPLTDEGTLATDDATPDTTFEARESYNLLSKMMTELPSPPDDIIRLRDIEGLSYHDIAQQLSLTETQVRVYLHRARQCIRERYLRLQRHGLEA